LRRISRVLLHFMCIMLKSNDRTAMPEQRLNSPNIRSLADKIGGEAVTEVVHSKLLSRFQTNTSFPSGGMQVILDQDPA
jgi:hypothetical protein